MQSNEIRACDICTKGLCLAGHRSFIRLRFERFGVDASLRHANQTNEAFFADGDCSLPSVADRGDKAREAAVLIDEPADLFVCETCAATQGDTLATLGQLAQVSLAERKAAAGNNDNGDHNHDSENQD